MGFVDRLKVGLQFAFQGQKGISGLDFLMGADASTYTPRMDFESLSKEGYEKNAIIYACINELGSSASDARLIVEVKDRKGEWEEKPDHGLKRLLDKPNPEISGYDFLFATTMFQSIAGNMFWEKERSKAGRVTALWPMRPDRVGIIVARSVPTERVKQRILAYTYRADMEAVTLPYRDVMHFKHRHPRDENWGLPPMAAAARERDTDNKATDFVRSFFDNAAVPRGIMKVQGHIDEAEEKRLKERLQNLYTGRAGWHDPLILGEGSEWIELAETFKDMDFPNLREIGEARLCMVFGVPPQVVGAYTGLMHATYSNYEEARRSFWQETLMPLYRKHEDTLNLLLAPEFGSDVRVRFDFSEVAALQTDRMEIYRTLTEAWAQALITRNMAYEELGFDPLPPAVGDIFLQNMMAMPVSITASTAPTPPESEKSYKAHSQATVEAQERFYKAFDGVARVWELSFRREAQERFKAELEKVLQILRKEGKQAVKGAPFADFLVHVSAYLIGNATGWFDGFHPLIAGLMAEQAENVLGALGFAFDIQRPEVQQFIEDYTIKFSKELVGITEAQVRELVSQAQAEGWSVPKLRNAIEDKWTEYDRVRAEMIARTETIRSSNAGTHEAWRQAGIRRKQWYAGLDGRQCGYCESLHIQYGPGTNGIEMEANFVNEGDEIIGTDEKIMVVTYGSVPYPPVHPRCRCTILAVVE